MDVPRDDRVTAAMPSMTSEVDDRVDGDADAGRGTHAAAVKAADARPERMDRRSTSGAVVVLHFDSGIICAPTRPADVAPFSYCCENPSTATAKEKMAPAIGTDGFILELRK